MADTVADPTLRPPSAAAPVRAVVIALSPEVVTAPSPADIPLTDVLRVPRRAHLRPMARASKAAAIPVVAVVAIRPMTVRQALPRVPRRPLDLVPKAAAIPVAAVPALPRHLVPPMPAAPARTATKATVPPPRVRRMPPSQVPLPILVPLPLPNMVATMSVAPAPAT